MTLSRITLRLARNPGTEFPNGDDRHGYSLVAPLDPEGYIDEPAYKSAHDRCIVRHLSPEFAEPHTGLLKRRGNNWFFDYDDTTTDDDEPVFKLGGHPFRRGEYVTITDEGGRRLTYVVKDIANA